MLAAMDEVEGEQSSAFAREAAGIFHEHLGASDRALPAIERALDGSPDDRELKIMKAQALRSAGEQEQARELLEAIIGEFGRRRSKERAAIHVELAYVLQAEGNHDLALKQIELASKMDAGNPKLLRKVAALAMDSGKPEKAEKSLQSLLLVVRRKPPGDELDAVGESEVLYELHRIARERDDDKADELLDAALEAAVQSDAEVARLESTLLGYGEHDIALRALEARLDATDKDASKAQLLTDIAAILEEHKDRAKDGLARRLEGLALGPERLDLHDQAAEAAKKAALVDTYVDRVAEIAGGMKREADTDLAGELWMRIGSLAESELSELDLARDYYGRAEAVPKQKAEALFALARVANAQNDTDEATRALDELTTMAEGQEPSPQQAAALYRLAEMQVGSEDLRPRGIEMLKRALAVDAKPTVAARILRTAAEAEPGNAEYMALYEGVARASGEWEILLDFLERRARMDGASPDQIREAVDLANTHGATERGEALLERAVSAARSSDEGLGSAVWAVLALARQKKSDDLIAARDLMFDIASLASQSDLIELGTELALAAAEADELELGAEILEFLRGRDPGRRDIWEPLADTYRKLGDRDRFMNVIVSTLPTLMDPAERNALRKQSARFLIDSGSAGEAVDPLRDALLDDPDDIEAAGMLEDVLRESGDDEGLADFLRARFDEARERGNPETMADVAVRLGSLLENMGSPDVLTVYQTALEVAPQNAQLLHRTIDILPAGAHGERASLQERLLTVEQEEQVPDLALGLADLQAALDNPDGALRALRLGQRRAPTDGRLRQRLESHYRDNGMWRDLAEMMVIEADALEDETLAVGRYREAAQLHREYLMDAMSAAAVLRKARDKSPGDAGLALELADCLRAAGDVRGASDALSAALAGDIDGSPRVDLLLTRADLLTELGELETATACLEEAYSLDPNRAAEGLWAGLDRQRSAAQQGGDRDNERAATLRLAELYAGSGHIEQASDMLISWVTVEPQDVEALLQLRDLDTTSERWHGVVTACARLIMVQHGEEQVDAAHRLAHAAHGMGDPGQARQGLEFAHQVQPENQIIRDHLKYVYENTGLLRELATVLLADAEYAAELDEQYEAYRKAADILVNRIGDAEAAIAPAQKAQELKPDDHETLVLLADVLTGSDRAHEAAAMLEPAIAAHKRRSPELASLQHRMARIAQVAGDQQTQLAWLKKAFDVDRKNGFIAAELAQLATELQDYDLALKPLRAISLMDTPGPISRTMALLWEAKIEHARGNRAKAELWAKKALREDPEFMEAQEFLSQIQE
ncbi:MAG: tetratricopeptide repeat protein [Deltaproteobacteria bacterium]|nr:tetratricopeptide repeat protein [Deltaproteobacteria bacterium]